MTAFTQANSAAVLLEVKDLELGFAPDYGSILAKLCFSVQRGEIVGILGESGCGKTLTALHLMGLLPPQAKASGSLKWQGEEISGYSPQQWQKLRGQELVMTFQDSLQALNPLQRVGRQIGEVLAIHHPELSHSLRKQEVLFWLRQLAFAKPEQVYKAYPHELSGGMRQRVCLAMALINKPQLLIADEVTTALDISVQTAVLQILSQLSRQQQLAILFISHDLRIHRSLCDRVLVYYAGAIVEEGAVEQVFTHPAHPYTRLLLKAMPANVRSGQSLSDIPGRVPNSQEIVAQHSAATSACIFAPRCPLCRPLCLGSKPNCVSLTPEHAVRCHLWQSSAGLAELRQQYFPATTNGGEEDV